MDTESWREDAPRFHAGDCRCVTRSEPNNSSRYPPVHRADTAFRASRTAPAGPTHAVSTKTGEAACGITVDGLEVLDQDWEEAFFVEKCPGCFAAILTDTDD